MLVAVSSLLMFLGVCFLMQFLTAKKQDQLYEALQKLKEGCCSLSLKFSMDKYLHYLLIKSDQCAPLMLIYRTDAPRVHFPFINGLSRFDKSYMHTNSSCIFHASLQEGHGFLKWFRAFLSSTYKKSSTASI